MKFFYLILAITFLVGLIILYFQMIVGVSIQVPFFGGYVEVSRYVLYLILLALASGVFFVLGIKGFLSSSSKIDDDFDL